MQNYTELVDFFEEQRRRTREEYFRTLVIADVCGKKVYDVVAFRFNSQGGYTREPLQLSQEHLRSIFLKQINYQDLEEIAELLIEGFVALISNDGNVKMDELKRFLLKEFRSTHISFSGANQTFPTKVGLVTIPLPIINGQLSGNDGLQQLVESLLLAKQQLSNNHL